MYAIAASLILPSIMPAATANIDGANVSVNKHGTALELIAISVTVCFVRYAVVLYANYLISGWSELAMGIADDQPAPGLDPGAIARLPCFVHRGNADGCGGIAAAVTECVVCLIVIEEGEMVRVLPNCRHAFHARCVDAWLSLRSTCPVCRATYR